MYNSSRVDKTEYVRHPLLLLSAIAIAGTTLPTAVQAKENWRDVVQRSALENDALTAYFQSGMIYEIRDNRSGKTLVSVKPEDLPSQQALFGTGGIDLDECTISQRLTENNHLIVTIQAPDDTVVRLQWSIDPGHGDLVLRASAKTPQPVEMLRITLPGCLLNQHRLVTVDAAGVGHAYHAPWNGSFGDATQSQLSFVHPLVALFEGPTRGWFIEGREVNIGPANLSASGQGDSVTIALARAFPTGTSEPQLFETRIRTYEKNWAVAVDPYVKWMQRDAGFTALDKPFHPPWVNDIKLMSHVRVGDYEGLEKLAKQVEPSKTLIGHTPGWRTSPADVNLPDYTPAPEAVEWFRKARTLGFHVAAQFNCQRLSSNFPDLVKHFRAGMQVTDADTVGNPLDAGQPFQLLSCSAAYKPWRDHLIQQMRGAIEAGVDLIYLDESTAPGGALVVDGITGIQGVMMLMQETIQAYPGIAIETEQFNPMSAKYSSFALARKPLGHPLGGYIFHRFIKILPGDEMYQPMTEPVMDAFAACGFMVTPVSHAEPSWLQIARAVLQYDLAPDSTLARAWLRRFEDHETRGVYPVFDSPNEEEGLRLFGYRGKDGTTAYYEKWLNRRGLVVYQGAEKPRWFGTRVTDVTTWSGPGVLRDWMPAVEAMPQWLIYQDGMQLGLNPKKSYVLDEQASLPPQRFHITAIPDDFSLSDDNSQVEAQYAGPNDSWFKIHFRANGILRMHVPNNFLVFLNGIAIKVDRDKQTAQATVTTPPDKPSTLIAFHQTDTLIDGPWAQLPLQFPREQRSWYVGRQDKLGYRSDGPLLQRYTSNDLYCHVGGWALVVGKLPEAATIRLAGAFGMNEGTTDSVGDAVVHINGQQVVRTSPGKPPYQIHSFEQDISRFAGQYVMLEFNTEGPIEGSGSADWHRPRIVVGGDGRVASGE